MNTKETQGLIRDYFEKLYSNELENLEKIEEFLDTYDLENLEKNRRISRYI
jgi:hypothetical protein